MPASQAVTGENVKGCALSRGGDCAVETVGSDVADDVAGVMVVSELVGVASDAGAFFCGQDGADVRSVEAGGGHP